MILPPQQQNRSYNLNINQANGVVLWGTNFLTHTVHHFSVFEADKERNKIEAEQLSHSHCEKQWNGSSIQQFHLTRPSLGPPSAQAVIIPII
jgi:hypothetical protein